MNNKVILVSIDGMRPDGLAACGNRFLLELAENGVSCLESRTVMPSVTLPCHSSLFFSVDADRHGITTNLWMPPVRPIPGISDVVKNAGGICGMFYNWEQLRDLASPGVNERTYYERIHTETNDSDGRVTEQCIDFIRQNDPDFVFLYLGVTDEKGHKHGWMSQEYLDAIAYASECVRKVYDACEGRYHIIITADHGGHDRSHGTDLKEDMVIPIIFWGALFEHGKKISGVSIKDIAPTIADVFGIRKPEDWEGHSVLC